MRKLGYSVRPAAADDVEQVARIEAECISPPWTNGAFASEINKKTTHFWVVTDDESDTEVMAYVVFSFPAEQAHIQTFAVKADRRQQGVGKYLLRQIIGFVMRKQGESIVLEVRKSNAAAVQLYQGLGFIVLHTMARFYPGGEDGYSMIYRTAQSRLTGDPDTDFENDGSEPPKNLN